MEIHQRLNENTLCVVTGQTVLDVVAEIAAVSDVFTGEACGCCSGAAGRGTRYNVRISKGYTFYELVCCDLECRAKLSFGQHKDTPTLFAKRSRMDENSGRSSYLPNNGWERYEAGNQAPQQQQQQQSRNNEYSAPVGPSNTPPPPQTNPADVPF